MASKPRMRFDQFARYRIAALLFSAMYVLLMTRAFLHWPTLGRQSILIMWFAFTTPALLLILWNVAQSSVDIYRRRRTLDRMLDERASDEVTP